MNRESIKNRIEKMINPIVKSRFVQSRFFKVLSWIFWITHFVVTAYLVDMFVSLLYVGHSFGYRILYKIGMLFNMTGSQIADLENRIIINQFFLVVTMTAIMTGLSILVRKFIFKKKIPLLWWTIIAPFVFLIVVWLIMFILYMIS